MGPVFGKDRALKQVIIECDRSYLKLKEIMNGLGVKTPLLVHSHSSQELPVWEYLAENGLDMVRFCEFTPNPKYGEIELGVARFCEYNCDSIIAIGGGSAIDVAKCIKLYCKMPKGELYFKQNYADTRIPLIAIPTTAGTGSESTPFSVMYYGGEKQSVHHESILPEYALLDPEALKTLPIYQKKCTVMDALCQAIESWWSIHSTIESREYAERAIKKISANLYEYVELNTERARAEIMSASNLAGRAIAVTATTAPHAMSYKLTTVYGLPHGHSVALCLPAVWRYMLSNIENCCDVRGEIYLLETFDKIAHAMGCSDAADAIERFENMLDRLGLVGPDEPDVGGAARLLAQSVNTDRLKNNPVLLDGDALYNMYLEILLK